MSRKFIVEIKEEDKENIEKTYEMMNSLKSLGIMLIDSNKYADKASEFYNRFVSNWHEVNEKYTSEWESIVTKYNLDANLLGKYKLSFRDNCVYLED